MKKILSILFMVAVGFICIVEANAQQLPDGYKKFLGVWNCQPSERPWGNIKVFDDGGQLVVRIKTGSDIWTCKNARLNDGKLYFSHGFIFERGSWTVKNGEIRTATGGNEGSVDKVYDSYRYGQRIANESQGVWCFYLKENANGDMELYGKVETLYSKDGVLLFDSSIRWNSEGKYTNW